jgi:ubiquinone/menaquinone biosynthesis C-methylase UbiE
MDSRMNKWPKSFTELTPEQKYISDDFMKYWHEVLPKRFGIVEKFNHEYVVKHAPKEFSRTLEIGSGLGEHLVYERLSEVQKRNYVALDLRENMIEELKKRFPEITACVGDCQSRLKFTDGYFDRILAIHVLEHLPNLPVTIQEMYRLCDKERGVFSVVIPCEGGMAYSLARRISARRIFEHRYKQPYQWFIEREHINRPEEILEELERFFRVVHRTFFPIPLSLTFCNLCIGMTLQPKS